MLFYKTNCFPPPVIGSIRISVNSILWCPLLFWQFPKKKEGHSILIQGQSWKQHLSDYTEIMVALSRGIWKCGLTRKDLWGNKAGCSAFVPSYCRAPRRQTHVEWKWINSWLHQWRPHIRKKNYFCKYTQLLSCFWHFTLPKWRTEIQIFDHFHR